MSDYGGGIDAQINVQDTLGVCQVFNIDYSKILFSSLVSGSAGQKGAEYKLTLLDDNISVAVSGEVSRTEDTISIPYNISGSDSEEVTQISVLILDKEYTAENANGAKVLDYKKMAEVSKDSDQKERGKQSIWQNTGR